MAAIQNGNEEAYKKAVQVRPDLVNIDQPELWQRVVAESNGKYVYDLSHYVDPRIGSEGLGRVFVGPSCPFGMVKPSPDCTPSPNSGWLPMPERVDGFAQVHVSGTGGGPKYGNVLVMPFGDGMDRVSHIDYRDYETIQLGYYDTRFKQSGIRTEITTSNRASFYRFTYPEDSLKSLAVDAGFSWEKVRYPMSGRHSSLSVPKYRCCPTMRWLVIPVSVADGTMERHIRCISMRKPTVRLCSHSRGKATASATRSRSMIQRKNRGFAAFCEIRQGGTTESGYFFPEQPEGQVQCPLRNSSLVVRRGA